MKLNKFIGELKKLQKEGYGNVEVHVIAHDNAIGESQGPVNNVSHYEKDVRDREGADKHLFDLTPKEMIYLHS
jgi:hypothetical protein